MYKAYSAIRVIKISIVIIHPKLMRLPSNLNLFYLHYHVTPFVLIKKHIKFYLNPLIYFLYVIILS